MAYTPPDRHALVLRITGLYTPPDRHALLLRLNPDLVALNSGQVQSTTASGEQVYQRGVGEQVQSTTATGRYLPPVKRYLTKTAGLPWQRGTRADERTALPWTASDRADRTTALAAAVGTPVDRDSALPWAESERADRRRALGWGDAERLQRAAELPWAEAEARQQRRRMPWGRAGVVHGQPLDVPWRNALPQDRTTVLGWEAGLRLDVSALLRWQRGTPADERRRLPWGVGTPVPFVGPRVIAIVVPPTPPPAPHCYQPPDRHVVYLRIVGGAEPRSRHALAPVLTCRRTRAYDIRSTLRMSHTLSVVRLPDRLPLAVTGVRLSADRDSWGWAMSVELADAASLVAVEPTPGSVRSIEITLDGHVWTGQVDGYTEDRRFNARGGSVTARSRTVQLTAPEAPERSYTNPSAATAQQLAAGELAFTGFNLDWQIPDWTIPAGVYSYDRQSPLAAIIQIASAAGAMVQSAPASDTVIVAPRYPDAPWALASLVPDFALGGGSWLAMGKRWAAGPAYNGVYISGRDQGVLARVYRDGTSGSPYAPMVVEPLATAVAPARGRGIEVIATSLPRQEIPIELPLRPSTQAPGLLKPGELGEIMDTVWGSYRAVVDSVQISADVGSEGVVAARQSAVLWRYLP